MSHRINVNFCTKTNSLFQSRVVVAVWSAHNFVLFYASSLSEIRVRLIRCSVAIWNVFSAMEEVCGGVAEAIHFLPPKQRELFQNVCAATVQCAAAVYFKTLPPPRRQCWHLCAAMNVSFFRLTETNIVLCGQVQCFLLKHSLHIIRYVHPTFHVPFPIFSPATF